MAMFDLKKATIKLCDGRKATLTTTASGGVNAQITLTDKSTHRGTRAVTIELIDPPGNNVPISVVVTDLAIAVTLATDGASAITTTASQLKTAIEGNSEANALVTVTLPGTGAAVVSAQAPTALVNGPRTLTVKIQEGTMDYSEKAPRTYTKDAGKLGTVRDGDEEPMDVKFDAIWDFIKASAGSGTPTVEDVLKKRGEAAAWETTSADPCAPYCIDIEVKFDPACGVVDKEYIQLWEFRYESLDRSLKEGSFNISGKCNFKEAVVMRAAA